jgi:poly-gamma-glutamate synthesis protein (capsule biosynthesis protein)
VALTFSPPRVARRRVPSLALLLVLLFVAACGASKNPAPATNTPLRSATATPSSPFTPTAAAVGVPVTPPVAARTPPPAFPTRPSAPAGASITISAVGDISLAREVVPRMEAAGAGYPYALVTHLIDGDIAFANLEGALTDRGEPWPKGYNFRTPPRFASGLRDAGFDVVSLANNHSMDYGQVGLLDTIDALGDVGVRSTGAGADAAAAHSPAIIEAHGLRVAFVACVGTPTEAGGFSIDQWLPRLHAPGVFVCEGAALTAAIGVARAAADFVIVTAHAGAEYRNVPDAMQVRLVDAALAAGADAFIGHHAHVVQPVELRGAHLVAWSLGNFIFDLDNVDLANIPVPRVSLILNITLTKGAGVTSFEAIPVTQDAAEDRPRPATADEAAILQELVAP